MIDKRETVGDNFPNANRRTDFFLLCVPASGRAFLENDMNMNEFIGRHCIVRTYSAGVFAGILKSLDGKTAVVTDARRLWYWDGAASLSQLAMAGVSRPANCKFPVAVPEVLLTEVIEIIPTTDEARRSIAAVPVWWV